PDGAALAEIEAREAALQTRVDSLVYAYCSLGHTIARVDPLAETRPQNPLLSLHEFGFNESDLDLRVSSKFFLDNRPMTLREMVAGLERIYADSIGSEFMHIQDPRIREWVRRRLETRPRNIPSRLSRGAQTCFRRRGLNSPLFEPAPSRSRRCRGRRKSARATTDAWRHRASSKSFGAAGARRRGFHCAGSRSRGAEPI